MGIPLFREPHPVSSSQAKVSSVCPYAIPGHSRHHHHHISSTTQRARPQIDDTTATRPLTSAEERRPTPRSSNHDSSGESSVPTRANRSQHHSSRNRGAEETVESHERSTARYTNRIVRSAPGTREHDDESRAAELVELYFQELARVRAAYTTTATNDTDTTSEVVDANRPSTERVLDQFVRRQRQGTSTPVADDASAIAAQMAQRSLEAEHRLAQRRETHRQYRSLHDTLIRDQQRSQRSPAEWLRNGHNEEEPEQ